MPPNGATLGVLFTGQGADYRRMGEGLMASDPVFRSVMGEFDAVCDDAGFARVTDVLYGAGERGTGLGELNVAQPATFAVEVALAEAIRANGFTFDVVMGHSLGEYAAATVAGVFDRADALRLVLERGRLIASLPATGTMVAAFGREETIRTLVSRLDAPVEVAAVNGPEEVVLSGLRPAVAAAAQVLETHGIAVKPLRVSRAGHCRLMLPIAEALRAHLNATPMSRPQVPVISNVTGALIDDASISTPNYWVQHLLATVEFHKGLKALAGYGANVLLEVGPKPVLLGLAAGVEELAEVSLVPTLAPTADDVERFDEALARLFESGCDLLADVRTGPPPVELPPRKLVGEPAWVGAQPEARRTGHAGGDGHLALRWEPWNPPQGGSASFEGFVVLGESEETREIRSALSHAGLADLTGGGRQAGPASATSRSVLFVDARLDARLDAEAAVADLVRPTLRTVGLINDLNDAQAGSQLWFVTRGQTGSDIARSCVRTAQLEYPDVIVGAIEIDAPSDAAHTAGAILAGGASERILAVRSGQASVPRLVEADTHANAEAPALTGRSALVTGGLAGLGLLTAELLAARGCKELHLCGRSGPSADARKRISAMEDAGARVHVHRGDVSDEAFVKEVCEELRSRSGCPDLVVHSAGVVSDRSLATVGEQDLRDVLTPKVEGARLLGRAFASRGWDPRVVLYSSLTAVVGNPGQVAHCLANTILDSAARRATDAGSLWTSVNWGPWAGVGHLESSPQILRRLSRLGMRAIMPDDLARHLDAAQIAGRDHLVVAPFDWKAFAAPRPGHACSILRHLADEPTAPEPSALGTPDGPLSVARVVGSAVEKVLEADDPDPGTSLFDLGLDSLSAVQLRNELQRGLNTSLPARYVYANPSVEALIESLAEEVGEEFAAQALQAARPAAPAPSDQAAGRCYDPSPQQRRWFHLNTKAGYGQRVVPILLRESFDEQNLRDRFARAIAALEILHTYYPGGRPTLVTPGNAAASAWMGVADLRDLPAAEATRAVSAEVAAVRQALPSPGADVPWRVRVVVTREEVLALVGLQHIEFDGATLELFARYLTDDSAAASAAANPEPYSRYAALASAAPGDTDREFFQALYSGLAQTSTLPRHPGFTETRALPSRLHAPEMPLLSSFDAEDTGGRDRLSAFGIVLASYALLAAEVTDRRSVVISTIRSGRTDHAHRACGGPFTTPFPVPIHTEGRYGRDLVRHCQEQVSEIMARTDFPVIELPECTATFSGFPVDSYFSDFGINFQNYTRHGSDRYEVVEVLGPVAHPVLRPEDFSELRRIPGLHLVLEDRDGDIWPYYWYHTDRFALDLVARWAARHRQIAFDLINSLRQER
ncbi:SDR family NAD(P)-dependent oxidoreductase [Streptomyces sp. NPDC046985]|uniref:SDR family NAD(P)-dependent oxidoreductase n=1 Tax=Streptomyces sp. NPDC046985 TaxID=3155377 RepID=UPI0033F4DB04